jgi:1-deoxy-D-xylulose-5-phosphate reductoisomerase
LGSTGSIGVSTLDVVRLHPEEYQVFGLAAGRNVELMLEQCRAFRPRMAVMAEAKAAEELARRVELENLDVHVESGSGAIEQLAATPEVDYVMAAIVGAEGLLSALAAARSGKRLLLANKESLVISGDLLMSEARENGAQILPIDSEHNAVFQCMPQELTDLDSMGVRRIILTASGGPFRTMPKEKLTDVTPEQACAHPNWSMGQKISVDSATMMNKGLEVIEACHLFAADVKRVEVAVHPQSIVHSLVEYIDGSTLAQMGNPDMRTPIAHALAWPKRTTSGVAGLDLFRMAELHFEPPDLERFPCLDLAMQAAHAGGTAPVILNAANEIAVQAFLDRRISFTRIAELNGEALERIPGEPMHSVEQVLAVDREARHLTSSWIAPN